MPYIDPQTVLSPQGKVRNLKVVYDSAPENGGWSVATMVWETNPNAVGLRWNGSPEENGKGNPQSHGHATWFIVPDELAPTILEAARKLEASKERDILRGYEEMAADTEGEEEAFDWIESHVGECL
jgi:hypothetical protein